MDDEPTPRKTWIRVLERDAGFSASGAADTEEAKTAADRRTYHVAIVDIVLNLDVPRDRGGLDVIDYLRRLREGTQCIVLSGQEDKALMRDLLHERAVTDYIIKDEIAEHGADFLVERVKAALKAVTVPKRSELWDRLATTLGGRLTENEFVDAVLRAASFKGGYKTLSDSLLTACKDLMPLLSQADHAGLTAEGHSGVFHGRFWSKGQGTAVELLAYGTNADASAIEAEWNTSGPNRLYQRTKGGFTVAIVACPALSRGDFLPMPT